MRKVLISLGILLILAGILWPWIGKLPFGRLPGDIVIHKPNFSFYFPITSMILLSVILSLLLWILRKWFF